MKLSMAETIVIAIENGSFYRKKQVDKKYKLTMKLEKR